MPGATDTTSKTRDRQLFGSTTISINLNHAATVAQNAPLGAKTEIRLVIAYLSLSGKVIDFHSLYPLLEKFVLNLLQTTILSFLMPFGYVNRFGTAFLQFFY